MGAAVKHEDYAQIMKDLGFEIQGKQGDVMSDIETVLSAIDTDDEKYILERLEISASKILPEAELVHKMKQVLANRAV
jgi:hypothetical protein